MPSGIYIRTEFHKNRISESLIGRKFSEEMRQKLSLANKGKHHASKETREKLSLSHIGKIPSEDTRKKMSHTHKIIGISMANLEKMKAARKNHSPWNKGLNKYTDERVNKNGNSISIATKGKIISAFARKKMSIAFTGRTVTDETKNKISTTMKTRFASGELTPNNSIRGKASFRKDLNTWFRSTWEANFARILNYLEIKWEYESKKCRFNLRHSTYICDFYLPELKAYVEIKGYLWPWSKNKLQDFITLFPAVADKTYIVDNEVYNTLIQTYKDKILDLE